MIESKSSFFPLVGLLVYTQAVQSFEVDGDAWPSATPIFHIYFQQAADRPDWNQAFEDAAGQWNKVTPFQFQIMRNSFADPCDDPNDSSESKNGARFSTAICGDAWDSTSIALTLIWIQGEKIAQSGILFNANKNWGVHHGGNPNLQAFGGIDFRRVAVHELGHALGLRHEDDVPSIMSTEIDMIEMPQQDDIDGAEFIFSNIPEEEAEPPASSSGGSLDAVTTVLLTIALLTAPRRTRGPKGRSAIGRKQTLNLCFPAALG